MATIRKVVLASGQMYHVYNRGVEKRPIFTRKRDYERSKEMLWYYRYSSPRLRFSSYKQLSPEATNSYVQMLTSQPLKVTIYCYSFMPNHFHFLIRQEIESGVTKFISQYSNSYAKYFNTKYRRVGPLFQGEFKAVRIENDEQLLHVSRYIHLNPVSAYLIKLKDLPTYPWTSLPEYIEPQVMSICNTDQILSRFSKENTYTTFINDQASYQRSLEPIEQLVFDE